jgi:hypothetical protein
MLVFAQSGAPNVFHNASVKVSPMLAVEFGLRRAVELREPSESDEVGVGRSATASSRFRRPSSCIRRRAVSAFGVPLPPPLAAVGVGSSCTSIDSGVNVGSQPCTLRRPWYCSTVPPGS